MEKLQTRKKKKKEKKKTDNCFTTGFLELVQVTPCQLLAHGSPTKERKERKERKKRKKESKKMMGQSWGIEPAHLFPFSLIKNKQKKMTFEVKNPKPDIQFLLFFQLAPFVDV